ncbi:MAG TPA: hypothetical protein VHZ76_06750 [Gammaproteobacteria bacterium]|nr:hypothetical protein [Gammaproteobacteria bacterium]
MTTRQKVILVIFVIILGVLIWQLVGLIRPNQNSVVAPVAAANTMNTIQPSAPKAVALTRPAPVPLTPRELQLLKQQQDLEAKYVSALNELQMLKIEREIVENNRAIMAARFDTLSTQKNIVALLNPSEPPVPPGEYAQKLVTPTTGAQGGEPAAQEAGYSVISVTQLHHRWSAVMGYQGRLYQVAVGDYLPIDGSKVLSIDKSGIWLERANVKRKVSMVPAI